MDIYNIRSITPFTRRAIRIFLSHAASHLSSVFVSGGIYHGNTVPNAHIEDAIAILDSFRRSFGRS